jgi:hypothetical protein
MRIVACLCAALFCGLFLFSQAPSSKLSIDTPKSSGTWFVCQHHGMYPAFNPRQADPFNPN